MRYSIRLLRSKGKSKEAVQDRSTERFGEKWKRTGPIVSRLIGVYSLTYTYSLQYMQVMCWVRFVNIRFGLDGC